MKTYETLDKLNQTLNVLNSGSYRGLIADKTIIAHTAIREAILITQMELLGMIFEEMDKSTLMIIANRYSGKYEVGSFWMFKSYYETGNYRNLAGQFDTPQKANEFIANVNRGKIELDEELTRLESLHP